MSDDKNKLDLEDLEARPRDVGAEEADELTGGYYKTAYKTTTTTSTYDPYASKTSTTTTSYPTKTTLYPTKV